MSDYVRSIDAETFSQLQRNANAGQTILMPAGIFDGNESYSEFDQKRTKYLDNIHYTRTESDAINIVSMTTSPRAYDAFDHCMDTIPQQGLKVWASKEDPNTIELRVRYTNPPGVNSIGVDGVVIGGSVDGETSGHLWADNTTFGVNQEKLITIRRTQGDAETIIHVSTKDGAQPISQTYTRADATLTLDYVGTTDVLVAAGFSHEVFTPSNDNNHGGCPNMVGRTSRGVCISRTPVFVETVPPYFFKNSRTGCDSSPGCAFTNCTNNPPTSITPDGLRAEGSLDNAGPICRAVETADVYEHLSKTQCGAADGPIPVIFNQSVIFTTTSKCVPIATLRLHQQSDGSETVAPFSAQTGNPKLVLISNLPSGDTIQSIYKVVR